MRRFEAAVAEMSLLVACFRVLDGVAVAVAAAVAGVMVLDGGGAVADRHSGLAVAVSPSWFSRTYRQPSVRESSVPQISAPSGQVCTHLERQPGSHGRWCPSGGACSGTGPRVADPPIRVEDRHQTGRRRRHLRPFRRSAPLARETAARGTRR